MEILRTKKKKIIIFVRYFLPGFKSGGPARTNCAISLEELASQLRNDPADKLVVGDGAALCAGYLNDAGIPCRMADESHRMQSAVGVALCAEEMAARGETVTAQALEPVYLRLSQAERERLARGLKITLD